MTGEKYARLLDRFGLWLILLWTVLVFSVLGLYLYAEKREYRSLARLAAQNISARDLIFAQWNASHGGVYVPVTPTTAPDPYLLHVAERDVRTPSGRTLTLVDPVAMIRQSEENAKEKPQVHLATTNPVRPENAADPWEAEGLSQFAQGITERTLFFERNDEPYLRYMQPLVVNDSCLGCHAPHGYQPGEIRGGYAVTISLAPIHATYRQHLLYGYLGCFLLWGGGVTGGALLKRRIDKGDASHRSDRKKLYEAEQNIHYLHYYDPLTALPNALFFKERVTEALEGISTGNRAFLVGVLGIDHYKRLKSTFGLEVAEELIRQTVARLRAVLRYDDTLAVLSEGRFLLMQPCRGGAGEVGRTVEALRQSLCEPLLVDGQELFVSLCFGFALAPEDGEDARTLISHAETAYSRAKGQGRDSFQVYSPLHNRRALEQIGLENTLRRALDRRQLELYYQPQVDVRTGRIVGAEALLRWRKPETGLVSPGDFIPLAEETGMILAIGEWAMVTACKEAARWRDELGEPLKVSVNVSPRQFQQADLVAIVDNALAESGLSPSSLVLEVTEGSIVQDVEHAVAVLHELKRRNIRIAIDDFGTGYSSLNYLKTFPLDQLKIDKSFVEEIQQKESSGVIVAAIVAMAHKLNLEIVAEGVETESQRDILTAQGCHQMQGYYYCRPMAADKFAELIRALKDDTSEYAQWWHEPAGESPLAGLAGMG